MKEDPDKQHKNMQLKFTGPLFKGAFSKTLLVMRLTAILMIAIFFQARAHGYAQKITLHERNTSLEKVFSEISKQTGYRFFYPEEILQAAKKVTVRIENGTLKQVLDDCFRNQELTYTISD